MVSFIDYFIHRITTIVKFKWVRKNIIMILNDHISLLAMFRKGKGFLFIATLLINFEGSSQSIIWRIFSSFATEWESAP